MSFLALARGFPRFRWAYRSHAGLEWAPTATMEPMQERHKANIRKPDPKKQEEHTREARTIKTKDDTSRTTGKEGITTERQQENDEAHHPLFARSRIGEGMRLTPRPNQIFTDKVGTFTHMSPEVLRRKPARLRFRVVGAPWPPWLGKGSSSHVAV